MTLTFTEENYLKAIYNLTHENDGRIPNLSIAERLNINPATVTEMLKKLHEKKLIDYSRSDGASLTKTGNAEALKVIRRHRLWETFLVQKLEFHWDEVHDVAEQLEHIDSEKLLEQIDKLLGHPKFDPHGDPIPDKEGNMPEFKAIPLSHGLPHKKYHLAGVANHSAPFLQFLDKISLAIHDEIEIKDIQDFDKSISVVLKGKINTIFSAEVSKNLLVV